MKNAFSLENKVILVTGASSGLGRSIAIEASKMGASLILMGRNKERLHETLCLCAEKNHKTVLLDLNNAAQTEEFISKVDKLDGIVNSAGIANTQLFNFLREESLKEVMDTNFFAPILFIQKLVKKKKINPNSSILFLASIAGTTITNLGFSSYSASKSAISGIAKTMALELASKKIRVNCLLPGMIRTELLNSIDSSAEDLNKDEKNYPLGYGKPEDVAYAAIYLLSDASKWVTGTNLKLDGGLTLR
jgi:NAD(P)-dependent dehydrogenase (short-subunit alcohol dehydrogenase family)